MQYKNENSISKGHSTCSEPYAPCDHHKPMNLFQDWLINLIFHHSFFFDNFMTSHMVHKVHCMYCDILILNFHFLLHLN